MNLEESGKQMLSGSLQSSSLCLRLTQSPQGVECRLESKTDGTIWADGAYRYAISHPVEGGVITYHCLKDISIESHADRLVISGQAGSLEIRHSWSLAVSDALEERITLTNNCGETVTLSDFSAGLTKPIADGAGKVFPDVAADLLAGVPFRHKPGYPSGVENEFRPEDFLRLSGGDYNVVDMFHHGCVPSNRWSSEGWAWLHDSCGLGVFKFNQERVEFSVISPVVSKNGVALQFGGAVLVMVPSDTLVIPPGGKVEFGVTRYMALQGGYNSAAYAFRQFLDENACRFPSDYDPPVHWEELYDNPEWNLGRFGQAGRQTRMITFTREMLEQEAAKARDYHCEALYLDPGWDTEFGTMIWGEEWLGPRKEFARLIREKYGLKLSLHCALATWMSIHGAGVAAWPSETWRADVDGRPIENSVCLASRQYLDIATERMLDQCSDGVSFLMFDGNGWAGGCWNPSHGHSVPLTKEELCRANLELAMRVHAEYPDVLIEMHDMLLGGMFQRYCPVYYKYGIPGSYNETWGFELMWHPLEDIFSGKARSLYYYNLACNIPLYLHLDLRQDNDKCLAFWWYASTCRHLAIGGTNEDPVMVLRHKHAMRRYGDLEPYYKRGEFFGIDENIHVHVHPDKTGLVANLFNLSGTSQVVGCQIPLKEVGLDPDGIYILPMGSGINQPERTLCIERYMEPWSSVVMEFRLMGD